jgi:hypothetical protein
MVTLSDIQIIDIFNTLTETERLTMAFNAHAYDNDGALVNIGTPWAMGFEPAEQEELIEACM